MSWTFDEALTVPPMTGLAEWLGSERVPALHPPLQVSGYARRFDWVRLVSVQAFWEEQGRGSLTRSIANLCTGISRLRTSLVVTVQRDGGDLVVLMGIGLDGVSGAGVIGEVASPLLGAALPHAELRPMVGDRTGLDRAMGRLFRPGHAVAVVGTPRQLNSPNDRSLIELLADSDRDRWTLTVEVDHVPFRALADRLVVIDERMQELVGRSGRTRRISATETVTEQDVAAEQLMTLLGRERERAEQSLRRGGFVMTSWLTAEDDGTLVGQAGVIAGGLVPNRLEPRGLSLFPATPGGAAPGTFVVADELASIIQPPIHDLRGFRVVEWSRFDAQPETFGHDGGRTTRLGTAMSGATLDYPRDRLTAHALVTGITGSGKSSFLNSLLADLERTPTVPYLVIEPTKQEYRALVPAASHWAVGDPADVGRFHLNPFEVPPGTPVQTHLDVLIALFTSCFSLISPLPFVLELAIRRAYEGRGWDLGSNTNPFAAADRDYPAYPCFSEVIAEAEAVVEELGYQGEVRHNVRGALRARLGAMTVGAKGAAFDTDRPFVFDEILARPFVINLDLVGSDEEKAFIIGLAMVRLWEARRGQHDRQLRHVVVLEEAHRVLRRDGARSSEDRSGAAFAAELFGNLLAEVRSAGQGVVIVDQSPRKLSSDALANTALKVAFRATYEDDKRELASALNLDDVQQRALTGLPNHRAVVFWEGMDRPVAATMTSKFPTAPTAPTADALPVATTETPTTSRVKARSVDPSTRPTAPATPTTPAPTAIPPSLELRELTLMWLVAPPADRPQIAAEAARIAQRLLPGRPSPEGVFATLTPQLVERLGQARRWSVSTREELSASSRRPGSTGLRDHLLDGSGPLRSCPDICAGGGCLLREPVRRRAAPLAADPRLAEEWVSLPGPRLQAQVALRLGPLGRSDLSPDLATTARRCLVAHSLGAQVTHAELTETWERV